MNTLGASKIQIYESTDGGRSWGNLPVATLLGTVKNQMLTANSNSDSHLVDYSGIVGYTYKAIVTFYAGDNSGSSTDGDTTSNVNAIK